MKEDTGDKKVSLVVLLHILQRTLFSEIYF